MLTTTKDGRISLAICALGIGIALFQNHHSTAQDFWANPVDGSWLQASNWLDGTTPVAADDVSINVVGSPYLITLYDSTDINSLSLDSAEATLLAATIAGAPDTLSVADNIVLNAGTFAAVNQYFIDAQNGLTINGGTFVPTNHSLILVSNGVTNNSGGTINIRGVRNSSGTASSGAALNVISGGLINDGLLKLESSRGSNAPVYSILEVSGTLSNSGTIDSRPFEGFAAGQRVIRADLLLNSGTIVNNDSSTLELWQLTGADYQNSGIINAQMYEIHVRELDTFTNMAAGQIVGTDIRFDGNQSVAAELTNEGSININGNMTIEQIVDVVNSGSIHTSTGSITDDNSSDVVNTGTITTGPAGSILKVGGSYEHGSTAILSGGTSLTLNSVDLFLNDGFTTDFAFTDLFQSNITGAGTYQSQAGTQTSVTFLDVANTIGWENSGLVALASTNTAIANFNGGFTNLPGSELRLKGIRNNSGSATFGAECHVVGTLENSGTIGLETSLGNVGGTFAILDVDGSIENGGIMESRPFEGTGSGSRIVRTNQLTNSGHIVQSDTGQFNFDRSNANYTNSGQIYANAGELRFINFDSFANSGKIVVDGDATLVLGGTAFSNETDGTLMGTGTVESFSLGTFTDSGNLRPGSSPGILTFDGVNYQQSATGILEIEIGGLVAGIEYDQVNFIGGSATFDGNLRLKFIDGFAPSQGESFDLILGNVTDNFQGVDVIGIQSGFNYEIDDLGGGLTLTALNDATAVVLGDVNQDGLVNLLDVGPFIQTLSGGIYQGEADTNQDGIVNLLDVDPFIILVSGG